MLFRRHSSKRAFTLMEMLLVVGLLAVLAAFLFPVFAKSMESSKTAGCIANQKKITSTLLLYAADNNNRLPNYGTLNGPQEDMWWNVIRPYLQQSGKDTGKLGMDYLRCPAAKKGSQMTYGVNYGANGYAPFSYDEGTAAFPGSKRLSQLSNNTFLLADLEGVNIATAIYHPKTWTLTVDYDKDGLLDSASAFLPAAPYNHVAMRHDGKAVFSFPDGSARLISAREWAESRTSAKPIWGGLDF